MRTKIFFTLFLMSLASCTMQVSETENGDTMEHGWNPRPTGGFDETHNYGKPTDIRKNPTNTGWQQSTRVQSSTTQLGPVKSLLASNFPEAGAYTAMFSIAAPSQLPGGLPILTPTSSIRCQAILNWIIEGNQVQRIFDIGNGTTITGVGSGANISVQDLTVTLPAGGSNNIEYQVSVSLAKGTRAQFQVPVVQPGAPSQIVGQPLLPVPNIIGPFALPPTSVLLFPVPVNAGVIAVKVSATDQTVPATNPRFVSAFQQLTLVSLAYAWVPVDDPSFVPLVPGTQFVAVTNFSNADTVLISLDWAIDG